MTFQLAAFIHHKATHFRLAFDEAGAVDLQTLGDFDHPLHLAGDDEVLGVDGALHIPGGSHHHFSGAVDAALDAAFHPEALGTAVNLALPERVLAQERVDRGSRAGFGVG